MDSGTRFAMKNGIERVASIAATTRILPNLLGYKAIRIEFLVLTD
jgi:hypothetical protein